MSLEIIEERLSSVIKPETVSQLKSGVWKERLEGLLPLSVELHFHFCLITGFNISICWNV